PFLPLFIADPGVNGFAASGSREVGVGGFGLGATGDVGIGNPFLGGGGPRGIQLAAKFTLAPHYGISLSSSCRWQEELLFATIIAELIGVSYYSVTQWISATSRRD